MGGSESSFSSCFSSKNEEDEREPRCTSTKMRPSDEDRGRYVGEPDIDMKASEFIANVYKIRSMDPEKKIERPV
ncbi:hypothetical protein COCNU_11G011670 [Cocos nucifera]|uniref:Uncharacterized protein n=1 Tax=Cocos nucifera TaxID=13894 RepID=A0A8K0NAI7_COCNU|nr:hypothetical protein COCNU_11G011670 [Cocos nucifera]